MVADPRADAVARRAVDLAATGGVNLPDELRLWALAGGRPRRGPHPVPGEPDELGLLLEAGLDATSRQALGAHYTPGVIADGLAARALLGHDRPRVGDPACGGGALLLAAARCLAARGEAPADVVARLWGADVDPVAVATTEVALTLWAGVSPPAGHLAVTDALVDPLPWPTLDVVIGNPPFLSQLDLRTTRRCGQTEALRARFGAAVRPYTDTSGLFLLLGCGLVGAGGTVAMLQPQSVLGARDAAGVRRALAAQARLREVWVPEGPGFAASVDVCAPILDVGTASGTGDPATGAAGAAAGIGAPDPEDADPEDMQLWVAHLARATGVPSVCLRGAGTLGDEAATTAAFRDEYYGLAAAVRERVDHPDGAPFVTTGLVDPGGSAWGERPARFARRLWDAPVVEVGALEGRAAAWVARTRVPKLLVATQTRVVEVAVDESGHWVAAVPLVVVLAPAARLWLLAAALSAPPVTAWAAERTAGTALTAGSIKLTASLVREVPLPADVEAWRVGADALRAGDVNLFAAAMTRAYGCDEEVLAWWHDRAKLPWPAASTVR